MLHVYSKVRSRGGVPSQDLKVPDLAAAADVAVFASRKSRDFVMGVMSSVEGDISLMGACVAALFVAIDVSCKHRAKMSTSSAWRTLAVLCGENGNAIFWKT